MYVMSLLFRFFQNYIGKKSFTRSSTGETTVRSIHMSMPVDIRPAGTVAIGPAARLPPSFRTHRYRAPAVGHSQLPGSTGMAAAAASATDTEPADGPPSIARFQRTGLIRDIPEGNRL